jgi:hypothetical protein
MGLEQAHAVVEALGLDAESRDLILGGTAATVLKLKA